MTNVIIIVVVLLVILSVLKVLVRGRKEPQSFPYEKEDKLLSAAERSFFGVLQEAVGDQLRVMAKIRLADVIRVKKGLSRSAYQTAFNHIQSKHCDFVVCDSTDFSIWFVVELDDSSHSRGKVQHRDTFVEKALAAAGVPLHRLSVKRAYSIQEVRAEIFGNTQASGGNTCFHMVM